MMDIDCIVQSFNEPQLDRCLKSVREQTYPYYRIVNVNGVIGTHNAFKRVVESVQTEWFSAIGGDCIYHKDALEKLVAFREKYIHPKCFLYCLGTYDPFMEINTGFLCLAKHSVVKMQVPMENALKFDRAYAGRLKAEGWFTKVDVNTIVGTHFEDPDEFQVFHRFFILATKDGNRGYGISRRIMSNLYERDHNSLQKLAIDALDFGLSKGPYPMSINNDYNLQMYEEFKKWKLMHS